MWRNISTHKRGDSEYLNHVMLRIKADKSLRTKADALISGAEKAEPLIADMLRTPQDPRWHSEGPFVRDHIRLILMTLYAIIDEKFHLVDVEELRRLKGYEGEIEELEEIIKENTAFFEVFALCHDVAKWATVFIDGGRSEQLGLLMTRSSIWDEYGASERSQKRKRYLDFFEEFTKAHKGESDQELQAKFFLLNGINVHYPGHGRMIHSPQYHSLLHRFVEAHGLTSRDRDLLEDLIGHHLDFNGDFREVSPKNIGRWMHFSESRGYDADDFIDLMQGCMFFDLVCGSGSQGPNGVFHDPTPLINCLESEHNHTPKRREEKLALREEVNKRKRNKVFREVGLDGIALMDLLGLEPGPDLGNVLRNIQDAVIGKGKMPVFDKKIQKEIENRAAEYYEKTFVKD